MSSELELSWSNIKNGIFYYLMVLEDGPRNADQTQGARVKSQDVLTII